MKKLSAEEIVERYEQMKTKQRLWSARSRVRQLLLAKKAVEAGITVSDQEINEYLNRK